MLGIVMACRFCYRNTEPVFGVRRDIKDLKREINDGKWYLCGTMKSRRLVPESKSNKEIGI